MPKIVKFSQKLFPGYWGSTVFVVFIVLRWKIEVQFPTKQMYLNYPVNTTSEDLQSLGTILMNILYNRLVLLPISYTQKASCDFFGLLLAHSSIFQNSLWNLAKRASNGPLKIPGPGGQHP